MGCDFRIVHSIRFKLQSILHIHLLKNNNILHNKYKNHILVLKTSFIDLSLYTVNKIGFQTKKNPLYYKRFCSNGTYVQGVHN